MATTLTFLGAAGTVTGSKTLVAHGSARLLVDAGLFQGLGELRRRNWQPLPFAAGELDAVVLTHAHLDHCGYLPALVDQGFAGPVVATPGTAALAEIVLRDSAHLQEEDARYAAEHGYSKHARPLPLYDTADVLRCLPLLRPTGYGEPVRLGDLEVVLQPAGHILGSASVLVDAGGRRVVFSGDLGRPVHPLLSPPPPPPACDALVVESTYGDRRHVTETDALADVITRTVDRGGSVVIPAFAVDRTEVVLIALRELTLAGAIPAVPIYVDSPMALAALDVYRAALERGDPGVRADLGAAALALAPGQVREAHTAEESKALNNPGRPCVIISASGMASGGRVVHHLRHLLPDRRNAVVLVGYQAEGTRGRDLVDGARQLKMHGRYVPVRAEVAAVDGFSVHADADELLAWVAATPEPPRVVYVVHGETRSAAALAARIGEELGWVAVVARDGERVRL